MNEIILNYIVQAVLGAASGYITNDYAINMLFKEYTPLKIGGVIKKTRGEFIERLSSMVESDIINKDKLQELLSDENLKIKFDNLTADFYNNCIDEAIGSDTWDKIITDDTDQFMRGLIIEHAPNIYDLLIKNLDTREFMNEHQLNSISSFFYDAVLDMLEANEYITKNVLLSVYNDSLSLTPEKIIDKNILHQIISCLVSSIKDNLIKYDNSEMKNMLGSAGIEKAVREAVDILLDKRVHEVINISNEIMVKIEDMVLLYINSDRGNTFIYNLCNSLFRYGKSIDKTITELLNSNFEENLRIYLIEAIPGITEKIVNWIRENNDSINRLLESAIDEVITESDGLKAKLLSTIKNAYLSNLSKKYSIVDKIAVYVESNSEPEKLSAYLSTKIIDMMNSATVGKLVEEIESNGFTPHKCTEIIISYINNNFTKVLNQAVLLIRDMRLKSIFPDFPLSNDLLDKAVIKFKELCSSQSTQDFITKRLSSYADDIMSSSLEDLLSEEQINTLSSDLNSFIVKKLKNNKDPVRAWICKQIYDIAGNQDIALSSEATELLNEELYKKYDAYSEDLKNTKLSVATDKLKSIDNIANNSSDYLRSYAIKNTDTILKDSVKLIVTDNLNKLNDDELVDLANDFIGRELKPIMFFGGVLGLIAGLALAAFQNKALDPQEISIANMILYAFVGFITNVIAINMIFKPYRENKFLAKIPFFRNFSVGYIVKNQKIFAEKTSYFIDNTLLNKDSISDLFESQERKIKNSFIKTAADNDYKIIKSLISDNKINIANKLFSFSQNMMSNNLNKLSNFLYEKIRKVKLFSAIERTNPFKNYADFIKPEKISKGIYGFINSNHYIKSSFIINYMSRLIDGFNKNKLINGIYSYEHKYKQFNKKKINEVLNENQLKIIEEFTAGKINSILLSQGTRNKMFQKLSSLLSSSVRKDDTIGEIFNGKIKNYIDSNTPRITDGIINVINKSIQDSKPRITLMIQSEIKSQLGFIEKSMYSLMGGDEIIDELLKKIISSKVPEYLEFKKHEINNIVSITMDEKVYETRAEVLYSIVNRLKIKELADSYVSEKSELIGSMVNARVIDLINNCENMSVGSVLNLFYLDDIRTAFKVYGAESDALTSVISENIKANKNNMISFVAELNKISYNDVFKHIKYEDIENLVNNLFDHLNKNNSMKKIIDDLLSFFIKSNVDTTIEQIINKEEFIDSLKTYISNLTESDESEKIINTIFIKTIDTAVSDNLDFINEDSKNYLFNIFIESTINSLRRNLDEILKSVEFDKIAKEEIEKMEPERIHEMFNSFCEKYFRRLMLYGFGGFVFGINVYIGMSLTALKVVSQLASKER